jgi:hypothetical protein
MAKKYAGMIRAAYGDTSSGSFTTIVGKLSAESAVTFPDTTTETTDGVIYGGGSIAADVFVLNMADYSALKTLAKADTEKFWRFTFKDGATFTTTEAINLSRVERMGGVNARDGVRGYSFHMERYGPDDLVSEA